MSDHFLQLQVISLIHCSDPDRTKHKGLQKWGSMRNGQYRLHMGNKLNWGWDERDLKEEAEIRRRGWLRSWGGKGRGSGGDLLGVDGADVVVGDVAEEIADAEEWAPNPSHAFLLLCALSFSLLSLLTAQLTTVWEAVNQGPFGTVQLQYISGLFLWMISALSSNQILPSIHVQTC